MEKWIDKFRQGVGTKTIITGDYVHQLYGWNGVIRKLKEPKLGPRVLL